MYFNHSHVLNNTIVPFLFPVLLTMVTMVTHILHFLIIHSRLNILFVQILQLLLFNSQFYNGYHGNILYASFFNQSQQT